MANYTTFEDLVRFHKEVIAPDLDARFGAIDGRFAPIERHLQAITRRMDRLDDNFTSLQDELVGTRRDMLTHFDMVYTRFDRMAIEDVALKGGLNRLEERVTILEKSRS